VKLALAALLLFQVSTLIISWEMDCDQYWEAVQSLLPAYREALQRSDTTSPELLKESERLDDLARRIKALGVEVNY